VKEQSEPLSVLGNGKKNKYVSYKDGEESAGDKIGINDECEPNDEKPRFVLTLTIDDVGASDDAEDQAEKQCHARAPTAATKRSKPPETV
jgi:hypothetical protein